MLFKRTRIPFTIPVDARELTEEEMILVNGGAEEKKESQESKSESVTVKSGNTLSGIVSDYNKANGTNYTVSDVAKNSGISNPDVIYPGQEIKFGSSSSTSGTSGSSNISTSSSASSSSVSMTNIGNTCTSNKTKDSSHHSAYDQQFINEMMEKEQKSAVGGNGIQGATVSEKTVEGSAVKPNTKSIVNIDSQYNSSALKEKVAGYTAKAVRDDTGRRTRGYSTTTENYPKASKNGPSQLGEQDPLPHGLRQDPDIKTIPANGDPNWYYPREFPNGEWNILKSVPKDGSKDFGTVFIPTNAHQTVPVYGNSPEHPKCENGNLPIATGTQEDTGYGFHYSDYQTTWGCGRGSTQPDITKFAKWSDQALSTFYGGSYVNVHD